MLRNTLVLAVLLAFSSSAAAGSVTAGSIKKPQNLFSQLRPPCVELSVGTIRLQVLDILDAMRGISADVQPRRICS